MSIKEAIDILNTLEQKHVIGRYAVAGAVAALNYIEPSLTFGLDILVSFENTQSRLATLKPIFDALAALGYAETQNEGVVIGGWPVQFLPVADALDSEALEQAQEVTFSMTEGTALVRVLRAKHVVATALRVGRPRTSPGSLNSSSSRPSSCNSWPACWTGMDCGRSGMNFASDSP